MSSKQLVVLVGAVTVLTLGLAWFLEQFYATQMQEGLMSQFRPYLARWSEFREWEAEHGE